MVRDKDRKRVIRTRMKNTGESYTTARAHVLAKSKTSQPAPRVDFVGLAGMSDEKIAAKTGRTWHEWVRALDAEQAVALPHREIAILVHGKYRVDDWWAQTVTVGYERIKGLRERGQRRSGEYEAGKSRTFNVSVNALFDAWADATTRRRWLGGIAPVVRTARARKSMRLRWPDGTLVIAGFTPKGETKSVLSVVHTKLRDRSACDKAKKYWTDRLDALGVVLSGHSR